MKNWPHLLMLLDHGCLAWHIELKIEEREKCCVFSRIFFQVIIIFTSSFLLISKLVIYIFFLKKSCWKSQSREKIKLNFLLLEQFRAILKRKFRKNKAKFLEILITHCVWLPPIIPVQNITRKKAKMSATFHSWKA